MAVNPRIASIIAAGYDKIGQISLQIIHNFDNGYGMSQKQEELRSRLIKTTKLVRILSKFVEFDSNGDFVQVHRLTDTVVNDLLKYLIKVADLDNLPVAPKIFYRGHPAIRVEGGPGPVGQTGGVGPTGGGRDFSSINFTADTFIDRFPLASARAARWDYFLYGALGRRSGTIRATWSDDALTITETSDLGTDDIGTTIGNVSFVVEKDGTDIVLKADITSGTWSVEGTRYWIPNQGNYVPPPTGLLPNGQIYVGDSSNNAVGRTPGGVLAMTNTGIFSFVAGAIVNADINATAAIAHTKMAALNASRVMVTDGAGFASASAITTTVLGYIGNLTSDAQAQINGKQATITGAATTVTSADLTVNRALVSGAGGKIEVHPTTTLTQVGYLNDVTSPIQAQFSTKQNTITGGATTVTTSDLTPNRLLISDASGKIAVSAAGSGAGAPGGSLNEIQKNGGGVFSGTGIFTGSTGFLSVTGNWAFSGTGDVTWSIVNPFGIGVTDGNTSAVVNVLKISHLAASASPGIGTGLEFRTQTATANAEIGGIIESVPTVLTSGSENFDLRFKIMSSGATATERVRISDFLFTIEGDMNLGFSSSSVTGRNIVAVGNQPNISIQLAPKGVGAVVVTNGCDLQVTGHTIVSGNLYLIGSGGISTEGASGPFLRTKVIAIGDWNMDTDLIKAVTHGLTATKIRTITVLIRDDTDVAYTPLNIYDLVANNGTVAGGVASNNATTIGLQRTPGGVYDNTGYDSTGYNRGWVTIEYEA